MAAQIDQLPAIDVDSMEDMEIPCDLKIAIVYKESITPARPCHEPAKWCGYYPCCGRIVLACEKHQADKNPFWCSQCHKNHRDLLNWTRL